MPYRSKFNQDEGDLYTGTRVCKVCLNRRAMTEFYWAKKDKIRVRTCKGCASLQAKKRKHANASYYREQGFRRNLRVKYGITFDQWESLLIAQGGKCAICASIIDRNTTHVDHCHDTDVVRGLLCFRCNTGLGKFGDSIEILYSAIKYLQSPPPILEGRTKVLTEAERRENRSRAAKLFHSSQKGQEALKRRSQQSIGEQNPASRLTDKQTLEIKKRYGAGGVSQRSLASEYGISQSLVSLIVLDKIRASITESVAKEVDG